MGAARAETVLAGLEPANPAPHPGPGRWLNGIGIILITALAFTVIGGTLSAP